MPTRTGQEIALRGEEGMTHFPRKTPGCYHHHIESCCWLCILRMLRAAIALRWRTR